MATPSYIETGTILKTLGYNVTNPINSFSDLGYLDTTASLDDIANRVLVEAINKVGYTYFNTCEWTTPFKRFFIDELTFGDIVEGFNIDVIQGKKWTNESEMGSKELDYHGLPNIKVTYSQNEFCTLFEYSVTKKDIRKAFKDMYALDRFLAELFNKAKLSIEIDLNNYAIANLSLTDSELYNENQVITVDAVEGATGSANFLKVLNNTSYLMTNPKNAYNSLAVVATTPKNKQVLVIRHDVLVNIDYDYLTGLFNIDKVENLPRIIEVEAFGKSTSADDSTIVENPNIIGVLMDEKAFYIFPRYIENKMTPNNRGRYENYYFHRDYSCGFKLGLNRVMFVTE